MPICYPRTTPGSDAHAAPPLPKAAMPVLMFHGLDDQALLSDGLNNTWDWLEKDLTLVTIPGGRDTSSSKTRAIL